MLVFEFLSADTCCVVNSKTVLIIGYKADGLGLIKSNGL